MALRINFALRERTMLRRTVDRQDFSSVVMIDDAHACFFGDMRYGTVPTSIAEARISAATDLCRCMLLAFGLDTIRCLSRDG